MVIVVFRDRVRISYVLVRVKARLGKVSVMLA